MNLPPTVCLDGAAVRRIREEKRLTQLYVAKVVGVTTDTISRWENNRYPTVRRENLFKLGEALEAPLHLLLRLDDQEAGGGAPPDAGEVAVAGDQRSPLVQHVAALLGAGVLLILIVAAAILVYRHGGKTGQPAPPASDFAGSRVLPGYAAAGTVIPVRLRLRLDHAAHGYIVREHFPPGWELIEAVPPASSIDNQDGMARWIIKQGEKPPLIVYLVRVDARSPAGMVGRFRGEIIANLDEKNQAAAVAGDAAITVAPYNWSDLNGDGSIDDAEMLEASQAFEEMEGVHLDWKELERLWDAGRYRFDAAGRRFLPVRNETQGAAGR